MDFINWQYLYQVKCEKSSCFTMTVLNAFHKSSFYWILRFAQNDALRTSSPALWPGRQLHFLIHIKLHFRGGACAGVSGEEDFRGGACESGDEVCGELANSGVVCLNGFVVAFAFDGDAVFGAFELYAEFLKAFVALEIGVVFGDGH